MIQKDAHDSPRSNAPKTPTEDSHMEHVHAMLKNTTAWYGIPAAGIPVGHEFTLSEWDSAQCTVHIRPRTWHNTQPHLRTVQDDVF